MIIIIVCILIIITISIITYFKSKTYNCLENSILTFIILSMFTGILLTLVILPMTNGLMEDYGEINQTGVLTNLTNKGLIWKTYEGELQKGTSNNSTVNRPFSFSVTNKDMIRKLKSYLGSKKIINIKCKQWLCMPFKRGSCDCEVIDVIEMEEEKENDRI
jgi:hypothetical protein